MTDGSGALGAADRIGGIGRRGKVVNLVQVKSDSALWIAVDCTDPGLVGQAVDRATYILGGIDALIDSGGVFLQMGF